MSLVSFNRNQVKFRCSWRCRCSLVPWLLCATTLKLLLDGEFFLFLVSHSSRLSHFSNDVFDFCHLLFLARSSRSHLLLVILVGLTDIELSRNHTLLLTRTPVVAGQFGMLLFWGSSRNSGGGFIEVHRLDLLLSLEMLLKVFSLALFLAVFRTQKDVVLAGCLIVDLLNRELICGDQLGNHSLETCNGLVSLGDRVGSIVWLAVSRRWHDSTLHRAFSSVMSLKHHTIVAEDWENRDGNEVGIVPETGLLGGLHLSVSVQSLSVNGLHVSHSRLVVLLAGLESPFGLIDLLCIICNMTNFHHGSDVARLISSCDVDLLGCQV